MRATKTVFRVYTSAMTAWDQKTGETAKVAAPRMAGPRLLVRILSVG